MENPDYFFSRSPEHCRVNPDNLLILLHHIKSAAFELPFEKGETLRRGKPGGTPRLSRRKGGAPPRRRPLALVGGELSRRRGEPPEHQPGKRRRRRYDGGRATTGSSPRWTGTAPSPPSTPTRSTWSNPSSTTWTSSIWSGRPPMSTRSRSDYYTDAMTYTNVRVIDAFAKKPGQEIIVEHGEVQVVRKVVGYKKIKFYTSENLGYGDVNLPEKDMHTTSYWFTIPRDRLAGAFLQPGGDHRRPVGARLQPPPPGGHDADGGSPRHRPGHRRQERRVVRPEGPELADDHDHAPAGGEPSRRPTPSTRRSFSSTPIPGGIGFSDLLFERHERCSPRPGSSSRSCPCTCGCPSCVGPTLEVGPTAKEVALAILDQMGN